MDFLQDEEMNVEYEVASNNTLFFDRYIGSRRHAPRIPKCDPETGEVIEKKRAEKLSFFLCFHRGYYDTPYGCFVLCDTFSCRAKPLPSESPEF